MTSTKFTTTWTTKLRGSVALLLSGSSYDSAQRSFLCCAPFEEICIIGEELIYRTVEKTVRLLGNPWDSLKQVLPLTAGYALPEWTGYLGYEMGCFADADYLLPHPGGTLPDARFVRWGKVMDEQGETAHPLYSRPLALSVFEGELQERPFESLNEYADKVCKIQELIREGEVYQTNLSQQTIRKSHLSPDELFCGLHSINPAPFSAFLNFGDEQIVSSSPERFLSCTAGRLETRPIKGTAPRGITAEEDTLNLERLLDSVKDRSELLMITDLMRNDLAKISKPGTVVTERIWHSEAYENVFHLLSVISGQLKEGTHPVDAVRACFPAGSITGCPKLRAMEVIASLEQRRRGVYTGAIGYFNGNGDFDFNVAIRTLYCRNGYVDVQLGGAVVIDSHPAEEYAETFHKGKSLFKVLN